MSEVKTPEQLAAEASAKKLAAEAAKAEKAAAKAAEKAAKDAEKAAAKAAKSAEKEAAAQAKAAEKAAKEAEKLAKQAEKAAKKPAQPEQNGVRRPREGGACAKVWAIADAVSAELASPAPIANVLERAKIENLDETTTRVQYARWKKFFGLSGRIVAPAAAQTASA
jgi:hypothetical protein